MFGKRRIWTHSEAGLAAQNPRLGVLKPHPPSTALEKLAAAPNLKTITATKNKPGIPRRQ